MSDCLYKAGNTFYSLNSNGEIIYSDVMPEKFIFDSYNYFIKTDVKISKNSLATTVLATLTANKYSLKDKYYKEIVSVVSNTNTKFLIQDGTNVYSVNPLTLVKSSGDITITDISNNGKTTVALTIDEINSLTDQAVLLSYVDTAEGLSDKACFDIKLYRSFLCTLGNDVKFLYYKLDTPLLDTVEICGLEDSTFTYKLSLGGVTTPLKEETISGNINSSITIPSSTFVTSENPYTVNVELTDEKLNVYNKSSLLTLRNVEPSVLITMSNMIAKIDFNDPDGNRIKYKVFLNGAQIVPSVAGTWTDLIQTPCYFTNKFKSNEIIIGGNNILKVDMEDEYGKTGHLIYNFTGTLSGLLFMDENNNVCSDDLGNIIKTFDMGKINAGKTSETKLVKIKNTCGYNVINAVIDIEAINPDSRYTVFISKENNPFVDNNTLTIASMPNNTEDYFYIKVVTNPDIEYGGNFFINVQSEPSR